MGIRRRLPATKMVNNFGVHDLMVKPGFLLYEGNNPG